MPHAQSAGAKIYYEEAGSGFPILFLHEFAGDYRSWADQVRYFSRGYRCITMDARGYPKSDVPETDAEYGQDLANRDAIAVLDHLGIGQAHIVGLSMGGFTSLQLAIHYPDRVKGVVPAGAGSGSFMATRKSFLEDAARTGDLMEKASRIDAEARSKGGTRIQLKNKDPLGWQIAVDHLASHPPKGSGRVMRNVQGKRPSLYELETELAQVKAPVLLLVGDEDEPCLDANLFMKRLMPTAQLAILPGCGHVINHEEPALFNHLVERFLSAVDRGTWRPRDPVSVPHATGGLFGAGAPKA